jgi:hypothetical protein
MSTAKQFKRIESQIRLLTLRDWATGLAICSALAAYICSGLGAKSKYSFKYFLNIGLWWLFSTVRFPAKLHFNRAFRCRSRLAFTHD